MFPVLAQMTFSFVQMASHQKINDLTI